MAFATLAAKLHSASTLHWSANMWFVRNPTDPLTLMYLILYWKACTEICSGLYWAKCGGICGHFVRDPMRRSEGVLGRMLERDLLVVPKDSVTQVMGSLVLVPVV